MASPSKSRTAARVALYPYQAAWVRDESRFKHAVKGRQIGWTFGAALSAVDRRLGQRGLTVWISASERQSREAIGYVKIHAQALEEVFDYEEIEFPGIEERAQQVTFRHNGSRILAMPANPATIRGFAGDVVLDEFAAHRDALQIWRGALAICSRGYQLATISTPKGRQGKFWELSRDAGVDPMGGMERPRWQAKQWSVHWCDIYSARAQGCPIDPDEMRAAAGDEDGFLQEYCCVFLADAENFIPLELIIASEHEGATLELPADFRPQGPCYLGVDIGRKKDRTVFWLKEKIGDVLWTRLVKVFERTPFHAQQAYGESILRLVQRACVDATGMGAMMAEEWKRKFGGKVEPVVFNLQNKERMMTEQKTSFEERRERIPAAPFIRRSLNAVKRYTSPTGHFRFDAERTEQGHADEAWASALGTAAASGPALSVDLHSAGRLNAGAYMGGVRSAGRTMRQSWG